MIHTLYDIPDWMAAMNANERDCSIAHYLAKLEAGDFLSILDLKILSYMTGQALRVWRYNTDNDAGLYSLTQEYIFDPKLDYIASICAAPENAALTAIIEEMRALLAGIHYQVGPPKDVFNHGNTHFDAMRFRRPLPPETGISRFNSADPALEVRIKQDYRAQLEQEFAPYLSQIPPALSATIVEDLWKALVRAWQEAQAEYGILGEAQVEQLERRVLERHAESLDFLKRAFQDADTAQWEDALKSPGARENFNKIIQAQETPLSLWGRAAHPAYGSYPPPAFSEAGGALLERTTSFKAVTKV